jgi:2-aminobenzoate-CoA ligase
MARHGAFDTFARDNLPPRGQWPELVFELPELHYPERLNCAAELLDGMVAAGHGGARRLGAGRRQARACTYCRCSPAPTASPAPSGLGLVAATVRRAARTTMMVACWLGIVKAGGIAVATMPLLRAKGTDADRRQARCSRSQ